MENLSEFLSSVIFPILCTAVTAILGYIGVKIKKSMDEKEISDTKKQVVEMCVKATEQLFKGYTSSEKFDECAKAASEMLESKGIPVTDLEIKYLIEAAIAEFNDAFKNSGKSKETESVTYSVSCGDESEFGEPLCDPVEVDEVD